MKTMPENRKPFLRAGRGLAVLLLLGFFEYLGAAGVLLVAPDPKNVIFLGYSLQRWAFFWLTLVPVLAFLWLGAQIWRGQRQILTTVAVRLAQRPALWSFLSLLAALAGLVCLVLPAGSLGPLAGYFERLRPFLVATGLFFFQVLLWLGAIEPREEHHQFRPFMGGLLFIALFVGLIWLTGLGITPDGDKWNLAGIPLTTLQFGALFFGAVLGLGLISRLPARIEKHIDWLLALLLYAVAFWLWVVTPMRASYFATAPLPPYGQSFPASDAAYHDFGALAILQGWGINAGMYIDKPLYMAFLAVLHRLAGYDYNLLVTLQVGVLALMVPILYWFGKTFQSRFMGILLAAIVLVRQVNAITLSNALVFNVNARMLMTEIPTMLGLVAIAALLFLWMKAPTRFRWLPLITGGLLGAVSLVRQNPALLFLAIPVIVLPGMWSDKKRWLIQSLQFALGFILLLTPWLLTGQDALGRPYFFIKFLDVIQMRYGWGYLPQPDGVQIVATDAALATLHLPMQAVNLPGDWLDFQRFPGFVFNHFFYNAVSSFLALPDSVLPFDQSLTALMQRPAWSSGQVVFAPGQAVFAILNLVLLACGLGCAWKRWRWTGLSPLLLFFAYSLSLALGRTSGTRFIPPIDWIIFLYYLLGFASLLQFLPRGLRTVLGLEAVENEEIPPARWQARLQYFGLAGLLCLALSIPVADNLVSDRSAELCGEVAQAGIPSSVAALPGADQMVFLKGRLLYPVREADGQRFTLFVCRGASDVFVPGFKQKVLPGQMLVIGWPQSADILHATLVIAGEGPDSQVLWMGEK